MLKRFCLVAQDCTEYIVIYVFCNSRQRAYKKIVGINVLYCGNIYFGDARFLTI